MVWLMALLIVMISLPDDRVSRLMFKFQTGGLETHLDVQYSMDFRLIFVSFFRVFA